MSRKEEFKKEFSELLNKYDATIYTITDGEGYSTTISMEIEMGNEVVFEKDDTSICSQDFTKNK